MLVLLSLLCVYSIELFFSILVIILPIFVHLQPHYGTVENFLSMDSWRVGSLFGRLLKKQYPSLKPQSSLQISLDDLLDWSYWPSFIKIYSMSYYNAFHTSIVPILCLMAEMNLPGAQMIQSTTIEESGV